jgi:hypothetical protein
MVVAGVQFYMYNDIIVQQSIDSSQAQPNELKKVPAAIPELPSFALVAGRLQRRLPIRLKMLIRDSNSSPPSVP